MLRFNAKNRRPVRNYSSRREQFRLLALFVPLALVILAMGRLRDPKVAGAINGFFSDAERPPVVQPASAVVKASETGRPLASPGVRDELLETITDNSYFRAAEKDAWFHFLELVQKADADGGPAVDVDYVQLVDQPDVYRGKLVTVRGTARQISEERPAENDLGLTSYYRVVVQPADGTDWPIIVYCLELPAGVTPGDELSLDVTATGLFFKKLSYKWRDGLGIAPVIVARTIGANGGATVSGSRPEALVDATVENDEPRVENGAEPQTVSEEIDGEAAFQKVLQLDGWTDERFGKLEEGGSLTDEQRLEALALLRRLRTIETDRLEESYSNLPLGYELTNPAEVRGKLKGLIGRVTKVTRRTLSAEDAQRLEMPEYFECEMELANLTEPATIITGRVPKDWFRGPEPFGISKAVALYVKRETKDGSAHTIWVAKEIAWLPGAPYTDTDVEDLFRDARDPLLGKSMLAACVMDVGLMDLIEPRGRIRPEERSTFYQVMRAASYIPPETMVRVAFDNLPAMKREWERQSKGKTSKQRKDLAREIVRMADERRYSVAMLFNDPEPQVGRVFVFDGTARRAVRVETPADIAERRGIDHYYELEVFTEDSQNYPLVFCVTELPGEFPVGANIHVPVRVAGFFFKNWLYSTRGRPVNETPADGTVAGPRAQYAPLLIGPSPIVLALPEASGGAGRFVLGGLLVLAVVGIWAAVAWFSSEDRRFRERTPAANFELPPGQSLNDLDVPVAELPMSNKVELPSGDSV